MIKFHKFIEIFCNYSYKYNSNDKIVNSSESVKKVNTTGYTRKKLKKIHKKKNSK